MVDRTDHPTSEWGKYYRDFYAISLLPQGNQGQLQNLQYQILHQDQRDFHGEPCTVPERRMSHKKMEGK